MRIIKPSKYLTNLQLGVCESSKGYGAVGGGGYQQESGV
jgi:hypothetical protein